MKLNQKLLLSAFLLSFTFSPQLQVNASPKAKQQTQESVEKLITVKSQIQSQDGGEALPFAAAVLVNKQTRVNYAVNAEEDGAIVWENIPEGNYTLRAFYVGFEQYEKDLVVRAGNHNTFEFATIQLKASKATQLSAVDIIDYRDLIEDRPDGLVYNAEQDGTNSGTTADELLRKVPMVTVDLDGNVSMRGSQNIKVLIDNKPSTILAQSVSDALKQLPSEQIKRVEVITSPGAKYDAEGTSGVINIITKRDIITGFNGMVFLGARNTFGYKDLNGHAGTRLNFRRDKLGIALNLGLGQWNRYADGFSERTDFPDTDMEQKMTQEYNSVMGGPFLWSGLNFDYQIDSLQTVFAGVNVNPGRYNNNQEMSTSFPSYGIDYRREIEDRTPNMNYSFNTSFNKVFKRHNRQTLDVLALYSLGRSGNKYQLNQFQAAENSPHYQERNTNNAKNNELTLQVDYAHPFTKQTLEVGAKFIHRDVGSDYHLEYMPMNADWTTDPNRTNGLDYIQQVTSTYAQLTTPIVSHLDAVIGLRVEHTLIDALQQKVTQGDGKFANDYFSFLPNAILTYSLPNFNKLKLAYFERIGRPSIDYINPYINYSDEFNLTQGNISLDPEHSRNIELGYSGLFGRSSVNVSAFHRFTNNGIELISVVDANTGRAMGTYDNLAKNNTTGVNASVSSRFFNKWMVNLNADVYYKNIKSEARNMANAGWEYRIHAYTNFQFGKGWSAEAFGMYNARTVMLQGVNSGYYFYSLGAKKSILKGQADITLGIFNPFNSHVKFTMEYNYDNAHYYNESRNAARGIRLAFSYRFGKMQFSPRAKQIKNDDLLDGGGNQQEGQQMM